MHASSSSNLCATLLRRVAEEADEDFVGVGFLCYSSLASLHHISMAVPEHKAGALPLSGMDALSGFLVDASRSTSPLHDGFHLIASRTMTLTHACQFISPSVRIANAKIKIPAGARRTTALLASTTKGIDAAGLLAVDGTGVVYVSGLTIFEERLR